MKTLPEGIDTRVLWQARGLPMFQEDLMAILSRFGGLDPIDAYQLVSAMALHRDEKVRKGEQAFLRGRGAERVYEAACGKPVRDRHGWGSPGHLQAHAISMAYLAAGLALGR